MDYTKGIWANTETAFSRFSMFRCKRTGARTFVTTGMELDQIAEVHGNTDVEAEANAHLIAAAPDLYETVKSAVWDLEQNAMPDIKPLKRALAKAEGIKDG